MPGSDYTIFLATRFDRTPDGRRLAFVSAMTLTQRSDGEAGVSYLEPVDLLQSQGSNTHGDCIELFRRVVFSILVHNTDDHLRNHGFFARGDYGLSKIEADEIIPRATAAVASWRSEATQLCIPKAEQDFMAAAFES